VVNSFANFHVATKVVLMALLVASPWLVVQIGIAVLAPDVEITEMPTCETTSGNCAHLGGGDDYRLLETYSTSLNQSSDEVYESLMVYINMNDWDVIYEDTSQENYYVHFVEKTKFWLFPDDVIVSIQASDSGSLLEIHSESRLGWGDLGVNPERIDNIYFELLSVD
jgi:uncharacterized protein (DUF1499 family)